MAGRTWLRHVASRKHRIAVRRSEHDGVPWARRPELQASAEPYDRDHRGRRRKRRPFLLRGPGWTLAPSALYNGVGTRLGEADWNQTVKAFLTDFMATDQIKGIHNIWMKMDAPQLPTEMKGVPFTIAQ